MVLGVLALTMSPHFRKVRHKNLVRLLGVILHNGLYIVMEFMSKVRVAGAQTVGPIAAPFSDKTHSLGLGCVDPGSPIPTVLPWLSSLRATWSTSCARGAARSSHCHSSCSSLCESSSHRPHRWGAPRDTVTPGWG